MAAAGSRLMHCRNNQWGKNILLWVRRTAESRQKYLMCSRWRRLPKLRGTHSSPPSIDYWTTHGDPSRCKRCNSIEIRCLQGHGILLFEWSSLVTWTSGQQANIKRWELRNRSRNSFTRLPVRCIDTGGTANLDSPLHHLQGTLSIASVPPEFDVVKSNICLWHQT